MLLILCVVCGCQRSADDPTAKLAAEELRWNGSPRGSNVILIINDTMRRDRVGIYGGAARTPAFNAFGEENLLFDTAYTQSPWTKPSMVTLFTSLYPSHHGVLSHPILRQRDGSSKDGSLNLRMDVLSQQFHTLAEILRDNGFRTAAFMGNPWLKKEFGFSQGFELYDDSLASWDVPGTVVSQSGLKWLEKVAPGERFFLYLHYMDSHRPYGRLKRSDLADRREQLRADKRVLSQHARSEIAKNVWMDEGVSAAAMGISPSITLVEMAYDRGIEEFDHALGLFLDGFKSHEMYEQTVIIVTSDHGEALFTRGWGNHGGGLYEDEVAIPLAARLPGISSDSSPIKSPVGLVDLLPTLCTYLNVELPGDATLFGRNWLESSASKGKLRDRHLVTEGVMYRPENRAIRFHGYKALWQPNPVGPAGKRGLFHIVEDAEEAHNLLTQRQGTKSAAKTYEDLIRGGVESVAPFAAPQVESVPLDPEVLERLRSLGYIK